AYDWPNARGIAFRRFWGYPNDDNGYLTMASISDGTSNTIIFSEGCVGKGGGDMSLKSGIVELGDSFRNTRIAPGFCNDTRGASGTYKPGAIGYHGEKGWRWADARNYCTLFSTQSPPNGPSCSANDVWAWSTNTASSYHTGGVNIAKCDGSVTFVSETINCGDQNNHNGYPGYTSGDCWRYSGASTFGVWGALGSRAGGESASL
ncbi:MAG: DUF1559 domain-containing protein, partial [Thermoguttaceae bacterium]